MLTLHLEAEDHQALAVLAIKTLGIVAVEKHELNAPQAILVRPATATPPAPAPAAEKAVELPKPEPRATRVKKTATPPVSPEAPAASAAATPVASPSLTPPAAVAAPVASASPVPSADDVRAALRPLVAVLGGEKAGEEKAAIWMASVGYERVSLVPEAKRAEFMELVKAKVASLTPAAVVVPTVDEVRYVLGELNGVFGMAACTALLDEYGASRPSDVPEAKRVELIKACKAKLASKQA